MSGEQIERWLKVLDGAVIRLDTAGCLAGDPRHRVRYDESRDALRQMRLELIAEVRLCGDGRAERG